MKNKLNSKNRRRFLILRFIIVSIFLLTGIFFTIRVVFPTEFALYSFKLARSPKNAITALKLDNNILEFYASTSQNFSTIELEVKLKNANQSLANRTVSLQKSYYAFFAPLENSASISTETLKENRLIKAGVSALVINKHEQFPFNNPRTFLNMGYSWENIEKDVIDTSNLTKGNLLNISSVHPNGTIFQTKENSDYYYYADNKKTKLPATSAIKNFKNNILVSKQSLDLTETCTLQKRILSKNKYYCTLSVEKLNDLIGKDYRFQIKNLPANIEFTEINLKLKKSITKKNLLAFLTTNKGRLFLHFGIPIE